VVSVVSAVLVCALRVHVSISLCACGIESPGRSVRTLS
jgi:hypothetical protein